jgi:hypothetical protein
MTDAEMILTLALQRIDDTDRRWVHPRPAGEIIAEAMATVPSEIGPAREYPIYLVRGELGAIAAAALRQVKQR